MKTPYVPSPADAKDIEHVHCMGCNGDECSGTAVVSDEAHAVLSQRSADLLAALVALLREFDQHCEDSGCPSVRIVADDARQAIAAARGK